jgi:ClpP class serine protease
MKRHALRTGEYLAIKPDVIQKDEAGFFFLAGPEAPENERMGSVCVVHVRGALAHFKCDGGDSYESILERVKCGIAADPPPSAVVFRVDSPGGVVAGLNETVLKLQKMSKDSGIPFVAYVDELAASAAYALCCGCSEILSPPSGIAGSVGVISTMVSQSKRDAAEGLDFRLITSGKRKADGHPHFEITDDAVKAETLRNTELASQFFELAGKSRGISPEKLQSLEAAIYLGKAAKRVGLVDDVMSFDDAILGLDTTETAPPPNPAPNAGNVTDRRAKDDVSLDTNGTRKLPLTQRGTPGGTPGKPNEAHMAVKLDALIKKTEALIATETDAKALRALQAKLSAYTATRAELDDDKGDDKKGDEDDGDEDSKSKKAAEAAKKAKKAAEAAKHRAKAAEYKQKSEEAEEAAKMAEEEDEEEEEEEEEEAEASLTPGAAAALSSQASLGSDAMRRLAALEKSAAAREHSAMIAEAKAQRRITPGEAKTLAKKSISFVKDFLDMRPNAIVATEEEELHVPNGDPDADVTPAALKQIEAALNACPDGTDKGKLRESLIASHRKARANGAAERY